MEKKENSPMISLVKKQDTFKLIVTEQLEKKIRHLCMKQPDDEWSGTLFYEHEGNFEDGSLVIKCIDVCLMDVGNATYTEFDMSPDVISYAMEHDLLEAQMGLIHSHDKMSTFFSGTDKDTLKEEGLDRNHFVSLIVNNEGSYTAGITRKVKSKKTITDVYSYATFEGEEVNTTKTYDVETEELEWFGLDITVEKDDFNELDARLNEIKKSKGSKTKITQGYQGYQGYHSEYPAYKGSTSTYGQQASSKSFVVPTTAANKIVKTVQTELPFDKPIDDYNIPYEYVHFDADTIKSLVLQLITGSIILSNESKINIYKWTAGMESLYEKRFGTGESGMKLFKAWAETYIEFICLFTEDKNLENLDYSDEEIAAICANDIMEALKDLPRNKYIDTYEEILLGYII